MELCHHFPRKIMSHATVKRLKASDAVSQSESAGLLPGGKCSGLCLPIAAIACKAPVKTGNVSINNTGPFPKQQKHSEPSKTSDRQTISEAFQKCS